MTSKSRDMSMTCSSPVPSSAASPGLEGRGRTGNQHKLFIIRTPFSRLDSSFHLSHDLHTDVPVAVKEGNDGDFPGREDHGERLVFREVLEGPCP